MDLKDSHNFFNFFKFFMAPSSILSKGLALSSNVTKLGGKIPFEIIFIRLLESNLSAQKKSKYIKTERRMDKAITIYSSCNWVRFFRPNDKDSNWLSSRSLLNIQAESEEHKIMECINR